jgi:hypothetical protein
LTLRSQLADGTQIYGNKSYPIPDIGDGSAGLLPAEFVRELEEITDAGIKEYYGKCMLTKVSNFFKTEDKSEKEGIENIGIVKPEQVRVIHYPDCQQIVFHMPRYAWHAGIFRITDLVTGEAITECEVKDRLSGSTMMLLNSLPLKPGFYNMEADWPDGWTHEIRFIKFTEGFPSSSYPGPPVNVMQAIKSQEVHLNLPIPEEPPKVDISELFVPAPYEGYQHPPGNVSVVQDDDEYRLFDSNGVEIENGVDLKKFEKELAAKFGPVVEYTQDGRGGSIFYMEEDVKITFDWEFAGGNAVVIILIPEEKYWENATKTPLSRRIEILSNLSRQVIKDQAPGCDFIIYSNTISIVRK